MSRVVDLTIARTLSLAGRRAGEKPAVICGDRVLSHGALADAAARLAGALQAFGLGKGDRLGVVLPNCPEYVAIALACARSSIVMVPLNYRFTAEEHATQLSDCGARLLIYGEIFGETVREVARRVAGLGTVCVGTAVAADLGSLDEILARNAPAGPADVSETDVFYLGYTSGTTGHPKGAMVTHRNRCLAYHYWALEFGIRDNDVVLHAGPFHHTAPFTFVLTQLFMGGTVVILEHFSASDVLAAIERHRVTWGFLVPYMLDRLVHAGAELKQHDLSSLRMIVSGASPLPTVTKEAVLDLLPGIGLHEFYGATEAGVITNLRPEDQRRKTRCVGRPVFDTEIEIRDEAGRPLPPGETGDIWMRGPTVFSGYFDAPDKTAAAFDGEWCTIGDVGRLDDEGYLYILDRRKDLIKSGGVNVFPIEIEEVLLAVPGIADVAAIGVPDPTWGEAVHAVVVANGDRPLADADVVAACRARLAGYKVPKSIEFRSALPRNANGKVLKRTLRQDFVDRMRTDMPV